MCENMQWQQHAIILAVIGLEYWLGKTKKVEANSTIQLAINMVKIFIMKTKGK